MAHRDQGRDRCALCRHPSPLDQQPGRRKKPTEVLLVAKVGQMEARDGCTVGLVLATGNPAANDQARKLADDKARTFACGKDRHTVIGKVPAFGRVDN